MRTYCQRKLTRKLENVLLQLTDEHYVHKSILLSNSSIAQHTRHIIEFYQSIVANGIIEKINYDKRERNILIETDRNSQSPCWKNWRLNCQKNIRTIQ